METSHETEPKVTACICHNRTFRELKDLAERCGWTTVEEITAATGCGSGCGLCRPYLEQMLRTGETDIKLIDIIKDPPPS